MTAHTDNYNNVISDTALKTYGDKESSQPCVFSEEVEGVSWPDHWECHPVTTFAGWLYVVRQPREIIREHLNPSCLGSFNVIPVKGHMYNQMFLRLGNVVIAHLKILAFPISEMRMDWPSLLRVIPLGRNRLETTVCMLLVTGS